MWHMVKLAALVMYPCKMQRGLLFLICAALLRFAFLGDSKAGDEADFFDSDLDFEIVNFADVPKAADCEPVVPQLSSATASSYHSSGPRRTSRFGLINHSNICYMSAFITAAFNCQTFKQALFSCEPKNASTFMLAQVFAKLQNAKSPVSTKLCLMPTLRNEIGWIFGSFEDNMEFSGRMLDLLPTSVRSVFTTLVRTNYYSAENGVLLKSKEETLPHLIIMPTFASITAAIAERFRSPLKYNIKQKDFHEYVGIVEPFEEEEKEFPAYSEEIIMSRPEIIIFGIGRKSLHAFNETPMELDFEFILPGLEEGSEPVKYILQSFCYHIPLHYISYARDFTGGNPEGDWYQYNDSVVSTVETSQDFEALKHHANTGATMAFYVRSDRVAKADSQQVEVPALVKKFADIFLALEEVQIRHESMTIKAAAEAKRAHYSKGSPTAGTKLPSSPQSSVELTASPLIKPLANRAGISSDDEKKRSANIPSPTNDRFMNAFPIDGIYFADWDQRAPSA